MGTTSWPTAREMWRADEMHAVGWSDDSLRRDAAAGRLRRVCRGVYLQGGPPTPFEVAIGAAVARDAVVCGRLAAVLHRMDGFLALPGFAAVPLVGAEMIVPLGASNRRGGARRASLEPHEIVEVGGVRCTSAARTLADLADSLTAAEWERAYESVLRGGVSPAEVRGALAGAGRRARAIAGDVFAVRPDGLRTTGSLMETLFLQVVRDLADLPAPERQVEVRTRHGDFVAYVDVAWPDLGVFVELDGQQHEGQPDDDADRQTRIAGATGWLCGRFRWWFVVGHPAITRRRTADLIVEARRRPAA